DLGCGHEWQRYWRDTSKAAPADLPPLLVVVPTIVGRVETGSRESGEQFVAHAASRFAGPLPRDPPAESTRIQQRRFFQPPCTYFDDPGEEQFVIGHRFDLERLAPHPGDAIA